jgi:hypothetical protein
MKVNPACFLEYLERNGFVCLYIDNFSITNVIYHFKNAIQFSIEGNCLPNSILIRYLKLFGLQLDSEFFALDKCLCNY